MTKEKTITLTPEEAAGLEGLRARLAQFEKLADIHPWLRQKNGLMTNLQIAARANYSMSILLECAIANADDQLKVNLGQIAVWLIHLAGNMQIDLVGLVNGQVDAERALNAMIAAQDTAAKT